MKFKRILSFFLIFVLLIGIFPVSRANAASEPPEIAAESAILIECSTDLVLYEKEADTLRYPASLTKLMTALITVESVSLDEIVTANGSAFEGLSIYGSTADIRHGEEMSVNDLLHCLLISSANEAANVLAQYVCDGSIDAFVQKMNARAKELGMTGTHYTNTHGLHDDDHYTTARDTATLVAEVMKHPELVEICATTAYTVPATNKSAERVLYSTNNLISTYKDKHYYYEYATGMKTGTTDAAGRCLAATADNGNIQLICIVLKSKLDEETKKQMNFVDATELFEWGFNNYGYRTILETGEPIDELHDIRFGKDRDYVLVAPKEKIVTLIDKTINFDDMTRTIVKNEGVEAPIEVGQVLGTVTVSYEGTDYGTVDLVATSTLECNKFAKTMSRIWHILTSKVMLISIAAFIGLIGIYIIFMIGYNARKRNRSYRGNGRGRR